jgi:hypothetical protein
MSSVDVGQSDHLAWLLGSDAEHSKCEQIMSSWILQWAIVTVVRSSACTLLPYNSNPVEPDIPREDSYCKPSTTIVSAVEAIVALAAQPAGNAVHKGQYSVTNGSNHRRSPQ